ncbi:class I SAM-dependent methyltransferase [Streptomyces sp. NPDC092369]|uniref:class I SAM-dependent methyltransferase n=1 Tax=Streptomyces sp. NPDC092369 TaxID=3366015 RepID=UPI003812E28B
MADTDTTSYVMGSSPEESDRLGVQASLYDGHTEHLLRAAGLREGMRVLDVGCGTGEVSLAAARVVGSSGRVLGVDMDPGVLRRARANAAAGSFTNVTFEQGVLPDLEVGGSFDALVGRLILIHLDDPVSTVKDLTRFVRRGGVVTFQDFNISRTRAVPAVPLVTETVEWISAALREGGRNPEMGEQLAEVLRLSGLPDPSVAAAAPAGGPDSAAVTLIAESARSLLPVMERGGIATAEEVNIDTLRERMARACQEVRATVYVPELVAAWAPVP